MTREEHLKFCKKCCNRQFNPDKGLVCSLTEKIADFQGNCNDYIHDESVKETVLREEASPQEIISSLPEDLKEKLRMHQDMLYAIVGGFFVSLICALLWAVVTVSTGYQIGYMAIGLGLAVGLGVRYFGSGIDAVYGVLGAVLALLGCALGNLFSQVGFIAQAESLGYFETLGLLNLEVIPLIFQESFSPMDILFYGIAAYEGYKFAFRPIPDDISQKEDLSPEYAQFRLPLVISAVIVISITAYSLSRGMNGPHTYYYASGALMSEGEYVNGEMNGIWTYYNEGGNQQLLAFYDHGKENGNWEWYFENGGLMKRGSYKSGLPEGTWLVYHENGLLSDSSNYSLGRLEGEAISFYENGQMIHQGNYHRDRQDGFWTLFYENGQKMAAGNFAAGKLSGQWKYWNPDGSPLQEFVYDQQEDHRIINAWDKEGRQIVKDGFGEYKSYLDDGTLSQRGQVEEGLKTGIWESYHANGKLKEQGRLEEGVYKIINTWTPQAVAQVIDGEGEYVSYLENTDLPIEKGMIKAGLREGYWESYHDNSMQQQASNYVQGKLHGSSRAYYRNGNLYVEGSFQDDMKEGEWNWYYESGLLESSVTYEKDQKQGVQLFWSETGRECKEEVYKNNQLISERIL